MSESKTIFALSSGLGKAGLAVIRVSGPVAGDALMGMSDRALPPARALVRRQLTHPTSKEVLDDGMVVLFPGPGSYTGEDVVELHVHGGRATVDAILEALGEIKGLRPAEAGEFTRRAFDHGRMDLTAVEGLADLIDAETAMQRRQALRQASGALAATYESWAGDLTRLLAYWEALIDFPDEDLPEEIQNRNEHEISRLYDQLTQHMDMGRQGERLRDGISIAILGPPNAGKSSILNRLAGWEAAIVSDREGTTRDVVSVQLDLAGIPVTIHDTAGLRDTEDEIEAEGTRRALARGSEADAVLLVSDGPKTFSFSPSAHQSVVRLVNKADLSSSTTTQALEGLRVSALTGLGFAELNGILTSLAKDLAGMTEAPVMTRARHRDALTHARDALGRARTQADPILAAEDLRESVRSIGRITGTVDVEDLLDVIFRDFCIGK